MPDTAVKDAPEAGQAAADKPHRAILFYDGVCVLCNRSVQTTIRFDKKSLIRHAALQGETAKRLLGDMTDEQRMAGVVLYVASDAQDGKNKDPQILQGPGAITKLGGILFPWLAWVYYVIQVPPFSWLARGIYSVIARRRYKWFGELETCPLPKPEDRHRYILD